MSFLYKKNKGIPLDPDEILADSVSALRREGVEMHLERPLEKIGGFIFTLVIFFCFGFLVWRAAWLTLINGKSFYIQSQQNRFLSRPIYAARGIIYDRFGHAFVENVPSFGLSFEKGEFLKKDGNLQKLLEELASLLGVSQEFFFELGFPRDYNPNSLPQRIFIMKNLTLKEAVQLNARVTDFPGINVFESYRRVYQDSYAYSHVLGFVGKISNEDLRSRPELKGEELVGKGGTEAFYDVFLRGRRGKKIIEVDASGRESRFRLMQKAKQGNSLVISLDKGLQDAAFRILDNHLNGNKGASIVIADPQNGEILSLISYPSFNINKFGYDLSSEEFKKVLNDPLKPLFNRAISGEFPSGSTIKPLIAAAVLEEKIIDPQKQIFDPGYLDVPHPYHPGEYSRFFDWKPHGWVDLYDALAVSANVYFYIVGGGYDKQAGLGIERIKRYATTFGLGSRLGIDLEGEKTGLFPDPEIKRIIEPQNPVWRIGDTYNVSIGQGGVKVTPLQMAMAASAIANGGTLWWPHLLKEIKDENGNIVKKIEPRPIRTNIVSPKTLMHVIKGMRRAVTDGTAKLLSSLPVKAAAKTGTAQAGSGLPHAWVTAFAPVENPEISVTVMVEHAGEGSTVAMPITYEILKWYFENRPK